MENNNIIGLKFEFYVYNLYKNLKKRNVRHNKIISINRRKNNNIRVQIDVVYSSWFKDYYVECKYRKENTKITLNEVAKFYAVLELLKVPAKRGEIVTNNYFNDRAKEYASSKGIKLHDLDNLVKMERSRQNIIRRIINPKIDIEQLIRKTKIRKNMSLIYQIASL
ncbi:MAG: restriction endonuclease [Nanoarchaeota archaeon]|nr:restriction endonuclease [Nanoarchaeota archaeon]MBU4283514.1 restriction endonuclease [Nanoarchaeota archaeon]MBU4493026.1 restriction endonuclease [Nanoarchaeota archaeon]